MNRYHFHDTHLVDINGWRFNFKRMTADRLEPTGHTRNNIWLIWLDKEKCITAPAQDLADIHPQTTSNHGTWDWNMWFSFFSPPEHYYNQMINEAYMNYLIEKSLNS